MNATNEQFLKDNLHQFITLERAFYLRGLSGSVRSDMQRIMSEEWQPGYTADLWCPPCVCDMITKLYRCYFNYLKELHKDTTEYKDLSQGIEILSQRPYPVAEPEKPLIVAAAFPSNKKVKK